jgi:hypothetical protein
VFKVGGSHRNPISISAEIPNGKREKGGPGEFKSPRADSTIYAYALMDGRPIMKRLFELSPKACLIIFDRQMKIGNEKTHITKRKGVPTNPPVPPLRQLGWN